MTEQDKFNSLLKDLKRQVLDINEERLDIKDKEAKREFNLLVKKVEANDELWEWEWFGKKGPYDCYSMGWCIVRDGNVIDSYCHSCS